MKSKILFIGPLPPPYSGPELSMKQFLESKVLNDEFKISFLKTNFRASNKNKGKFGFKMISNFFVFFYKYISKLIINRPNCIYYPITPTQIGWLGRDVWTILIGKLFGIKVIIHLRGSHFKLNFKDFNKYAKKLIGYTLKKVDIAIVQAEYLNDQFIPYISKEKVKVLYQAMDILEFERDTSIVNQQGKILVVGHLTKSKGYTDVLKIIPDIVEDFPNTKFYFAGDMRKGERGVFYNQYNGDKITYEDPFEAENKILNSKYKDNYRNLGIIKGEDKMYHFNSAMIFLSASYSEGFSRSILEAMALSKPLIYTPVGAHKEVLTNNLNGYMTVPGDLKMLTENIKKALSNTKKLSEIGELNRKQVEENFTIEKIANNFKDIILQTLRA